MATAEQKKLMEVYNGLNTSLTKQANCLPSGFNKDRFIQNCMTVLQDGNLDVTKLDVTSLKRTLVKGAYLGLDFFNKECYAIQYGNKVNFQTDYKGEIKLTKKYCTRPIKDIYAKVVRKGDDFEEKIIDGQATIDFKPMPFNDNEIIGVFAVVLFEDGGLMYETMSKKDVESIRNSYSKAPNSPAWKNSYGEMMKKTVLRRLCKHIDLDFESVEMQREWNDASDFQFDTETKVKNDIELNSNTEIFVESEVVETEPPKEEVKAETTKPKATKKAEKENVETKAEPKQETFEGMEEVPPIFQ